MNEPENWSVEMTTTPARDIIRDAYMSTDLNARIRQDLSQGSAWEVWCIAVGELELGLCLEHEAGEPIGYSWASWAGDSDLFGEDGSPYESEARAAVAAFLEMAARWEQTATVALP